MPEATCPECQRHVKVFAQEHCQRCYNRLLGNGTLKPVRPHPRRDRLTRWLAEVEGQDGCWLWPWSVYGSGYGRFRAAGATGPVHRLVYERLVGPVPDGLELDHLCRVRLCANPTHLEAVTRQENIIRAVPYWPKHHNMPLRTHCKSGAHELTDENVTVRNGQRYCRPCLEAKRAIRKASTGPRHGTETRCPQGHEYSGDNLYTDIRGRSCRRCRRDRQRERRARLRAQST